MALRDRFFTRKTADAMMGPAGILAAGAGVAGGILLGLGALPAVGVGALLWVARVAIGMPRGRPGPRLETRGLRRPWVDYAKEALRARHSFDDAVGRARAGAVQDRMATIGEKIAHGVEAVFAIAHRAQTLQDALARIDVSRAATELAGMRQDPANATNPAMARIMEALEGQIDTARRLDAQVNEAAQNLRLLDARLDEAVARSIELSVRADSGSDLSTLDEEIDDMVIEMEALRQALDVTEAPTATPLPLPPPPETGTTSYG